VADTTVWFPPGRWVDYFTGATFTGPLTATLSVPLDRMPVFVSAGGIIPQQPSTATTAPATAGPRVLKVFSGSNGTFSLYGDSGTGLGYANGQFTETPISDSVGSVRGGGSSTPSRVTIGPTRGHYPGEPTAVAYHLELIDLTQPSLVTLNGRRLARQPPGSNAPGWSFQVGTATVVVNTASLPTTQALTVVASGGLPVNRPEPSAVSS
jgi:hypothetical protein